MSQKKLNLNSLYLEVTRRCNMDCDHCMRGDAQNKDLDIRALRPFFQTIKSIRTIGFTGGEPSICPEKLLETLEIVKEYHIPVFAIDVTTNGKTLPDTFLMALIQWYAYCLDCGGEPECSGIALSKDEFHDDIPKINEYKLRSLSFFQTHKIVHYLEQNRSIIDKGHASERLSIYELRPYTSEDLYVTVSDDTIDLYDNNLLITVNKNILPDCDYAYDEEDELAIGRADQPEAFLDYLLEQAENESA